HDELAPVAAAHPFGVVEQLVPPLDVGAADRSRGPWPRRFVDRRDELQRLVAVDQPHASDRLDRMREPGPAALDVEGPLERADPEAEALVDRGFGCPQDRQRLTALAR